MMTSVDRDLDVYDEEKTDADASLDFRDLFSIIKRLTWWKDCDEEDCENLFDFAQRWR
jgi:hypothetical protein